MVEMSTFSYLASWDSHGSRASKKLSLVFIRLVRRLLLRDISDVGVTSGYRLKITFIQQR